MKQQLRVLVVEDSEDDYHLLVRELGRGPYQVVDRRVETADEMRAALAADRWDLVISDFSLPRFNAREALGVLTATGLDVPFLIVSGTITEEIAVGVLKAGAHDFMLKDRLARLLPAIERELREAAGRQERKKIESQLRVADRMVSVGTLAAGVAHEINNPLAALMGNLALARAELEKLAAGAGPETARAREELSDAADAAERIRSIVRDLMVFSRGQAEKRGPVDVERVMESTLRMARNEIRHRARVVKSYSPVPPVDADESRIGQVFLNLVVNAAQAMSEGSADQNEIRIATRTDEKGRVVVEIGDTGPGIPAEVLERIFTPFITTKPVGLGTGLGLSICHRVVTELGGEIAVETAAGRGTLFRLTLPASTTAAKEPVRAPPPEKAAGRRARVLVIDDEAMIGTLVRRSIGGAHDVTATTRAKEALERIGGGERFDLILCDLMMPEMTGMELHAELLRVAPEQAAKTVFLTGGAFTERGSAFLAGVSNRRLDKPFLPEQLRELVADVVR